MKDGRARSAPKRLDHELVEARRSLAAAEDEQHTGPRRQVEGATALGPRGRAVPGRDRAAGDAVLRPVAALDREREEDPPRERRREPVRKPEVRVRLHERRRDPHPRRGVDHRPRDVASAAEHDVGLPLPQDPPTGPRRAHRPPERPSLRRTRPALAAPRPETCRARSPLQERAAPRRDPATRRTSRGRPRAASASATASDGSTWPAVPPAAIRHLSGCFSTIVPRC